jgi:hypothetical protein
MERNMSGVVVNLVSRHIKDMPDAFLGELLLKMYLGELVLPDEQLKDVCLEYDKRRNSEYIAGLSNGLIS